MCSAGAGGGRRSLRPSGYRLVARRPGGERPPPSRHPRAGGALLAAVFAACASPGVFDGFTAGGPDAMPDACSARSTRRTTPHTSVPGARSASTGSTTSRTSSWAAARRTGRPPSTATGATTASGPVARRRPACGRRRAVPTRPGRRPPRADRGRQGSRTGAMRPRATFRRRAPARRGNDPARGPRPPRARRRSRGGT